MLWNAPAGVVTEIGPVTTLLGTVAPIEVLFVTVNPAAAVPLKLTALAPLKFWPVRVIRFPGALLVGVKFEIDPGK